MSSQMYMCTRMHSRYKTVRHMTLGVYNIQLLTLLLTGQTSLTLQFSSIELLKRSYHQEN